MKRYRIEEHKAKHTRGKHFKKVQQLHEGEPVVLRLAKYPSDRAARTDWWDECCGCGLQHMRTYEVFEAMDKPGEMYLVVRGYRLPE